MSKPRVLVARLYGQRLESWPQSRYMFIVRANELDERSLRVRKVPDFVFVGPNGTQRTRAVVEFRSSGTLYAFGHPMQMQREITHALRLAGYEAITFADPNGTVTLQREAAGWARVRRTVCETHGLAS